MSQEKQQGIFSVGDVLNNTYRIEEVLGRGGTSEVYRARSEISGRVMAVKALRMEYSRNEDFLALMTREEDMREIRHDAIVRYYDNQRTDDGLIYLVMDYVEGPGLDDKIKDGGMSADDLMIVARRVAEGLAAAHAKNIVHRDLSPDNIILRHGDPADAVIIDFGIAKDTNPGSETIVGNEFAGKYAYAAPEQLSGQTDARADIYALGALLLATFKGKAPDIGSNPMEVIQHKSEPLDTEGVPDPLRSLIDQMTRANRDARLQTAEAVLAQIDDLKGSVVGATAIDFGEDEQTIIVPRPSPPSITPPPNQKTLSGGGGRIPVLAVLTVLTIGLGGYFAGLFDTLITPAYPRADPYTLIARRLDGGAPAVIGNVPSEDTAEALRSLMADLDGTADLTLSSGDIPATWGADIAQLIALVSVLPAWQVVADGSRVRVTGTTDDAAQKSQLSRLFDDGALLAGLSGTAEIAYQPAILHADDLKPILSAYADCGALELIGAPAAGYGAGTQVQVLGKVAEISTRVALSDALTAQIGDRDLLLNVDIMNPTLCLVSEVLPNVPQGGFDIAFSMGDDGSGNTSGRYFVGENPVIDVVIPADIKGGFLFVSALDVSGNVFHLLPNLLKEENDIAKLRDDKDGPVSVRVAHPLDQAADGSKLAFTVDDTSLGKTQIVVINAEGQIFEGLRPTTESAGGYASALANYSGKVRTLDSRILTTALP